MSTIAQMVLYDVYSNLPAGGIAGRIFYVSGSGTNAGNVYRDNGATWDLVIPGGRVLNTRNISTTAPLTGGGDLSADRTLVISNMTGDSGGGGARGAVPAPGAGDAAAGKFLKADATWAVPTGSNVGIIDVDTPPGSPSSWDDEFNGSGLAGAWTVQTNSANAASVNSQVPGHLYCNFNAATQTYIITKAFAPGAGAIDVTMALKGIFAANYNSLGVRVQDTAAGVTNTVALQLQYNSASSNLNFETQWWITGTPSNSRVTAPIQQGVKVYLHLQRSGGGVWSTWYSYDGVGWVQLVSNVGSSMNPTISYLEIIFNDADSSTNHWQAAVDWIRVNWLTLP